VRLTWSVAGTNRKTRMKPNKLRPLQENNKSLYRGWRAEKQDSREEAKELGGAQGLTLEASWGS
jgi:hypothetical protein